MKNAWAKGSNFIKVTEGKVHAEVAAAAFRTASKKAGFLRDSNVGLYDISILKPSAFS
jgi:hypothetical protein